VAIDEIKMDRDNRIEKIRGELNEANDRMDVVNQEYHALMVKHQWLQDEYEKMEIEFNKVVENLD